MNWTGGSLQRTKTANGGVLQQQKAYFARARTHLQNELNAPVAPFQSRYLHGSGDTNSLFPLLGTDSNGNTGHARRQQKKGSRASSSRSYSQYRNRDSPKNAQDSCHRLHQPSTDITVAAVTTAGKSKPTKDTTKIDPEYRLLSRNRRRLLRQADWAGVNPLKVANLVMPSPIERHRIGKRRKTEVKPGTVTRRSTTHIFASKRPQEAVVIGRLQDGVRQDVPHDLLIRIGRDALTSACPSLRDECVSMQGYHDPMLFDEETEDPETFQPSELARAGNHRPNGGLSAPQQSHAAQSEISPTDDQNERDCNLSRVSVEPRSQYGPEPDHSKEEQIDDQSKHIGKYRMDIDQTGISDPDHRMRGQPRGIQQRLRFTFRGSNSPGSNDCRGLTGDNCCKHSGNERTQSTVLMFAEAAPTQVEGMAEIPRAGMLYSAHPVGNTEPWESLFRIPSEDSSHWATTTESKNSVLRLSPTAKNNKEAVKTWSQLAVQGDETLSSSEVSASLPSVRRGIGIPASMDEPITDRGSLDAPKKTISQKVSDDEKLWQAFVFGSENTASSQSTGDPDDEVALLKEAEEPSATTLKSLSKPKDVSRVASMAPPPPVALRQRSSPVITGVLEPSSKGEPGRIPAHRSASLLSDASCDLGLDAARLFRRTRTAAGYSMQRARNRLCTQAPISTRERPTHSAFRSSMQAIPSSDTSDGNLHLVDPEANE